MFGLIYYFFIGLFKIFYELYTSTVSLIRRVRGLNGDGTGFGYVDYHGVFRDRVTNKHAYMNNTTGRFEDYRGNVLYDPHIERIAKYREENRKESIEKGRSTYVWLNLTDDRYDTKHPNIVGTRYKDIETGKIYVTRNVEFEHYYVDIDTGELVRYTDSWQRFRNKCPIKFGRIEHFKSEEDFKNKIEKLKGTYLDMRSGNEVYERGQI